MKQPNLKCKHANQISSSQTHETSTHGSSRRCRTPATPLRSTISDSLPVTQLPIPPTLDSAQNRRAFIPHRVFNQLSNALQRLTSSMQANNTPAPGNAESTHDHTIDDGTLNDEWSLTIGNSTLNVEDTDALSEVSE